MKTFIESFLTLSALILGTATFAVAADDHDGHDHSKHDHSHDKSEVGSTNDESKSFEISKDFQQQIDLQTQVVEIQEIEGRTEDVIAIPRTSLVEMGGKTFVYAQSEGKEDRFERWEVTVKAINEQFVEAVTGVFPGDTLVSSGTAEIGRMQNSDPSDTTEDMLVSQQPNAVDKTTAPAFPTTESRRTQYLETDEPFAEGNVCQFARERSPRPHCNANPDVRLDFRCEIPVRVFVEDFHGHEYREPLHIQGAHGSYDTHYHGHRHDHHHGW